MSSYYFAYGSNMDEQQMRERCPNAKVIGMAELPGYELGFTIYSPKRKCGCADIIQNSVRSVFGLLYEISSADMELLDGFEGAPIHYQRISVAVVDTVGKKVIAETYEVVSKSAQFQKPSQDYLGKLTSAAQKFSFPKEYQSFLGVIETVD